MNDIKSLLEKYQIPYKSYGKNIGKNFLGLDECPYNGCGGNHFGINIHKPFYKCFVCGSGGRLQKLLVKLLKISYKKADKLVKECYDIEIEEEEEKEPDENEESFIKLYNSFGECREEHKQYLEKRNFNSDYLIKKYGLKSGGITSKYRYRIIFPIIMNNRIVNFGARDWSKNQETRYLYCEDTKSIVKRSDLLYNGDSVKNKKCVIVEGPTKCWRFGDGSVATLSINFTKSQVLQFLKMNLDKVFVIFDPGELSQKQAENLANQLSIKFEVEVVDIGIDLGDISDDDVKHLKKELRI